MRDKLKQQYKRITIKQKMIFFFKSFRMGYLLFSQVSYFVFLCLKGFHSTDQFEISVTEGNIL